MIDAATHVKLQEICDRLAGRPFLQQWEDIITVLRAMPVVLDALRDARTEALLEAADFVMKTDGDDDLAGMIRSLITGRVQP